MINKLIIPTHEVVARIISVPSIEVIPKVNTWNGPAFYSLLVLILVNFVTAVLWIWEHVFRNYWCRYRLEPLHSRGWMEKRFKGLVLAKGLFPEKKFLEKWQGGTIYCFCIINRGATQDYIYSAKIVNGKEEEDISIEHIIKEVPLIDGKTGVEQYVYVFENLPHGLGSLQGEIWFVAIQNNAFINVKTPKLKIRTAVKEYNLQITDEMFIQSMGTEAYNKDLNG